MNTLSQEELRNILALIARANISGQEAMAVAVLQQKINTMLAPEPVEETKKK
jgi:hypothetical protein